MNTSKRCAGPLSESLCCPVCSAEPGNWSELQQHLTEHLCDVFKNGLRDASMASQEQGCRAVRQAVAEGGNERDVIRRKVDVLTTLSLVNAAELRELTATVFKTYLIPCSEPVAEAMAEAGRRHQEAAGAIKNKPEAERAEAHEQLGPPYVHVWVAFLCNLVATKGLAAEHVSMVKTCWESNMVKSASVELASRERHCRVKPCQRRVDAQHVLPRHCHTPPRGSSGCSAAAAERSEELRPGSARPTRARSIEVTDTDAGEIERLARRLDPHTHRMAELVRSGVLEPSFACAFLMKKGGQQVNQGQGSETLPGADE